MSNAAPWAATAGNKFREVARFPGIPTTKLLAEGLTALTEALRELDVVPPLPLQQRLIHASHPPTAGHTVALNPRHPDPTSAEPPSAS
jgi:hypothetical protein